MSTEVLEKLKFSLEQAAEQIDELMLKVDEAIVQGHQLQLPFSYDGKIHTSTDAMGIFAYKMLPGGHQLMVDLEDVAQLTRPLRLKVEMSRTSTRPYYSVAARVMDGKTKGSRALSRIILRSPPGVQVHHKDHNPFNCRRHNLAELTPKEHAQVKREPVELQPMLPFLEAAE